MTTDLIGEVLEKIKLISGQEHKKTAFCLETAANINNDRLLVLPLRMTEHLVCGAAKVYTLQEAGRLIASLDGKVDYIFVDAEIKLSGLADLERFVRREVKQSKVLTLKVNDYTAMALEALIAQKANGDKKNIAIIGAGNIGSKLALKLVEKGLTVKVVNSTLEKSGLVAAAINLLKTKNSSGSAVAATSLEAGQDADLLIGLTAGIPAITADVVSLMRSGGLIIDGGLGSLSREAISLAQEKDISILRLDSRAGFSGQICTLLETEQLISRIIGRKGRLVAGGEFGKEGDVIVDAIDHPQRVLGLCDGSGGLKKLLDENEVRELGLWKKRIES